MRMRSERRVLGEQMTTWRRHEFLGRLVQRILPRAVIPALNRIDGGPAPVWAYSMLVDLLGRPQKAKVIAHADRISPTLINVLNRLPDAASHAGPVGVIAQRA